MNILRIFAFGLVLVGMVTAGTGCSKNDEKEAYLTEKYKQLKAEADAKTAAQKPVVVAPPPAQTTAAQ